MSEKTILYIAATIVLLHIIIGLGWIFWKMRKRKPTNDKKNREVKPL